MKLNGTPTLPPAQIQLSANQAAVVAALERLMQAISIEGQQLVQLWNQGEEARRLAECLVALTRQRDAFVQGCSRLVVAHSMPAAPLVGQ